MLRTMVLIVQILLNNYPLKRIKGTYSLSILLQTVFGGKRQVEFSNEEMRTYRKINLGSSRKILPDYINVDIEYYPGIDVICDLRYLPFKSEVFDIVRASNVLEHFDFVYTHDLLETIKEFRRILKWDRWMIVSVPDFIACCWWGILSPYLIDPLHRYYDRGVIIGVFALNLPLMNRHKMVFSFRSIQNILEKLCEFKKVKRLNYIKEHPYTLGITDDSTNIYSINISAQK